VRTVASQKDKSADLFALTARSENCLSSYCEPAGALRLIHVEKQKTAEGTDGQAGRITRQLRAAACFAFPWQKLESVQVCRGAADGVADKAYESAFHKVQIQPIEQPNTEEFGGEAA
jgi:hypothetical protein